MVYVLLGVLKLAKLPLSALCKVTTWYRKLQHKRQVGCMLRKTFRYPPVNRRIYGWRYRAGSLPTDLEGHVELCDDDDGADAGIRVGSLTIAKMENGRTYRVYRVVIGTPGM